MAGTIPLSLTQRLDKTTFRPLSGGKLYFIQAGTTSTPQNAYQDAALTIPWPNPLTLDAAGNIPQLFFADGSIKIRLTSSTGVPQFVADGILVVGPSGGGGGGSTVDATTVLQTGDIKIRYGTGVIDGFVRANGTSIGSSTSGASENASAAAQALFEYLWNTDANLRVLPSRGASAAADWSANKTIDLPDWRGRAIAGLADMGTSAAAWLTSTYFGTSPIVLGAAGGNQSHTISLAELPTGITTSGVNTINVANASQSINVANASQSISVTNASQNISVANAAQSITASGVNSISASGSNSISVTSTAATWVRNTGSINSQTTFGGGPQALFADVTAVSMAAVTSSNASQNITVANASQNISVSGSNSITASGVNSISATGVNSITASGTNNITASGSNTITATSNNTGAGTMSIMPPTMLVTIYIKL